MCDVAWCAPCTWAPLRWALPTKEHYNKCSTFTFTFDLRPFTWSSKVTEFGTNRKRVRNFLLVRHSNLGPILHRFRYITGFCAHHPTPIPLLLGVPFGPDRPCYGVNPNSIPLANERWNYFRSIPTCDKNIPEHHRHADRWRTYCGITALCTASHGKNVKRF